MNNLVNLFIIGINKAGSSWLYYLLSNHPDIFMSQQKELYYFNEKYPSEIEQYHSNFDFDEDYKYFGEATPTYYREKSIAENIAEYSPEAKIFVIVRDPIQRVKSQFHYHKQLGLVDEDTSINQVLQIDDTRIIADSHYENTLPIYEDIFGDNFHIVSLEKANEKKDIVWDEIQEFLDIKRINFPDFSTSRENATGSYGFRLIYKITIRPIKNLFPSLYHKMLHWNWIRNSKKFLIDKLGRADKEELDPSVYNDLKKEFYATYKYLHNKGYTETY